MNSLISNSFCWLIGNVFSAQHVAVIDAFVKIPFSGLVHPRLHFLGVSLLFGFVLFVRFVEIFELHS